MTDKNEELIQRAARDLKQFGGMPIILQLGLPQVLAMISLMQLGLRHPGTAGSQQDAMCREIIAHFSEQLEGYPALQEMIAAGFNPDFDTR